MFSGFFSNAKSKLSASLQLIPGISFFREKVSCLSQFAYNPLKKLLGLCPVIGLTGRGLSINGFIFNLNNISAQFSQSFKFIMAMCFVTTTQAQQIMKRYDFIDPQRNTSYRLDLSLDSSNWWSVKPDDIASRILTTCNASDANPPYPNSFFSIYRTTEGVRASYDGGQVDIIEELFRATGDMANDFFEKCLREMMGNQISSLGSTEIILFCTIFIGTPALFTIFCCLYAKYCTHQNQQQSQTASVHTHYGAVSDINSDRSIEISRLGIK